jgi:ABC-type lipoprotein export system ATPase subunit
LSKVEKRLGHFGNVTINFELETGEKYQITRTYDAETNPLVCINTNTNDPYDGEIAKIFPVLFYSQNEISRTADDAEAQLRLIDSFIDPSIYNADIKSLISKLLKVDKELADSIAAIAETTDIQTELSGVNERLRNIDSALKNELYTEIKTWEKNKELFEGHLLYHKKVIENLESSKKELSRISIQKIDNVDERTRIELDKISAKSKELSTKLFDSILQNITKNQTSIQGKFDHWLPEFVKKQTEYINMIRDSGGDKTKLESERRRLNKQFEKLTGDFKQFSEKLGNFTIIIKKRNEYLDALDSVYFDYFTARKEIFDRLNHQSGRKLSLKLVHKGNRERFKTELLNLKKGSKIREQDINKISNKILPRKFVDLLISNDATNLAIEVGISVENSKKLIDSLNSRENLVDILSIAYTAYPEDIPTIEFMKDDGQYYPISELSGGQKSIALLIIALSEGTKPIIIDQPEDALDNPSVYDDVVSKLRGGKENRQFILTTHNSNIGVASDSDNFIILKSSAKIGKIDCCGAIDKQKVKSEVINHLEGGDEPYELKNKKYHMT